jgi:hypothetical protein
MIEVTAYHNPNAPIHRQWIAYVVMDNGNLWGVYATATLEWQAKEKIRDLWESERQKVARMPRDNNPWASETALLPDQPEGEKTSGRGSHTAGLKWVINPKSGERVRVSSVNAEQLIANGWRYGKKL